jgi:hypothetical protein
MGGGGRYGPRRPIIISGRETFDAAPGFFLVNVQLTRPSRQITSGFKGRKRADRPPSLQRLHAHHGGAFFMGHVVALIRFWKRIFFYALRWGVVIISSSAAICVAAPKFVADLANIDILAAIGSCLDLQIPSRRGNEEMVTTP